MTRSVYVTAYKSGMFIQRLLFIFLSFSRKFFVIFVYCNEKHNATGNYYDDNVFGSKALGGF